MNKSFDIVLAMWMLEFFIMWLYVTILSNDYVCVSSLDTYWITSVCQALLLVLEICKTMKQNILPAWDLHPSSGWQGMENII